MIGHLDLRAKAAFARDKFDPANLKSRQLIKFGRFETKKGEKPSETVLYLRIDPARAAEGYLRRFHDANGPGGGSPALKEV